MAGGGGYQDEGGTISEINVTPLVDVVLVLLVIFMVTAPMIAARGILVDSPKTVSGEQVSGPLRLTLTAEGTLYVNDLKFEANERKSAIAEIRRYYQQDRELKAIVAGDKDVSHGDFMEVIDLVKQVGISKFAISTAQKRADQVTPPPDGDDKPTEVEPR